MPNPPLLLPSILLGSLAGVGVAQSNEVLTERVFTKPVRLKAEGASVQVETPGYASPCWGDVDGDGKPDLIVGQFHQGKIRVFRNIGKGTLAAGQWLQAGGEIATVPGVW